MNRLCFPILAAFLAGASAHAAPPAGALNDHLAFEDLKFLDQDIIARAGAGTPAERGLELTEGRFGKALLLTRETETRAGADRDLAAAILAGFRAGKEPDSFDEPVFWGAGRLHPHAGAVAFWIRGRLREGILFEQTANAAGRGERGLIEVTVAPNGCFAASLTDARYVRHTVISEIAPEDGAWYHLVLNWDRAGGLELFVNGKSSASSWGRDPWWEAALPGLLRFPMPGTAVDEAYFFGRPLSAKEIEALMKSNTPPPRPATLTERTPGERDLLARALGVSSRSLLPVLTPAAPGMILAFRQIEPSWMGYGRVPAHLCHDGRYELAWPHPAASGSGDPGDADFTAEALEIDPPAGVPFNYITIEGNLSKLPVYINSRRAGDSFGGETLVAPPDSGIGFLHGEMVDRTPRGRITLPFLKERGTPEGFRGDVHLALTGETRVHEVGLFDVSSITDEPVPGELTYHIHGDGDLNDRYGAALSKLCPTIDRAFFVAHLTPGSHPARTVETGLLRRTHLLTAPMTASRCFDGITLELPVRTTGEDLLLVRLRDSAVPSRIWTHAELKLKGFEGAEARLRLRLEFTPLMLAPGDRVWLEIATLNGAKIRVGGPDGARMILRPAVSAEAPAAWERKELLPAIAEYGRAFDSLLWTAEGSAPDFLRPPAFGGPFDTVFPAQAVKRLLPWSRLADFHLEYTGSGYIRGNPAEPEKLAPPKSFDIPSGTPRWAWYQQKVRAFRCRVLEWIAANQNPDGQFGGGWIDDLARLEGMPDLFLDCSPLARPVRERLQAGLSATGLDEDGYCRIDPVTPGQVAALFRDRFRDIIYYPGDPARFRRALRTAWRGDKPAETPLNWGEGEAFLPDRSILGWYWGKSLPPAFSLADTAAVTSRLARMASWCDDLAFHRATEARLPSDTQVLFDEPLVSSMIIGGAADSTVSAEWLEGGGEDLARWVTHADSSSFECRMFSFDPLQRKVTARLFRLRPGTYEVKLSEDLDGIAGRALHTGDSALGRFETFSVLVPPGKPVILTIRLVTPGGGGPLPDLAIAGYDCIRSADRLWVRISNLGGAPSGKTTLRLYDAADHELAEQKLPEIPPALDFVEKSVWVTFDKIPQTGKLRLVADPLLKMRELFKGNNSVEIE